MGGVPPLQPPANCGEEGRRGDREERAGARRGSLALRCPANTAQPDGPGSGGVSLAARIGDSQRRKDAKTQREENRIRHFSASLRLCVFAIEFSEGADSMIALFLGLMLANFVFLIATAGL